MAGLTIFVWNLTGLQRLGWTMVGQTSALSARLNLVKNLTEQTIVLLVLTVCLTHSTWYCKSTYSFCLGDGRADFLWVDKFNGDTKVWENIGELPNGERVGGSSFCWSLKGIVYKGSSRGSNMHFPNIGGVGRADIVDVNPTTAKVSRSSSIHC